MANGAHSTTDARVSDHSVLKHAVALHIRWIMLDGVASLLFRYNPIGWITVLRPEIMGRGISGGIIGRKGGERVEK